MLAKRVRPVAPVESGARGLGFSPSHTSSMNKHEERRCAACGAKEVSLRTAAVREANNGD